MSEKNVTARKSYWANMDPVEKSRRMREIAKKRQSGMTFKEKRDHAMKMVKARQAKKSAII